MPNRDKKIDVFKACIVFGMIFVHLTQFFYNANSLITIPFNLISFPGFVFAFGYANYLAYLSNNRNITKSILKNIVKLYFVFVFSSFFYLLFVEKLPLTTELVLSILNFSKIANFSEFLLSFIFYNAMTLIFRRKINQLVTNKHLMLISSVLCLLSIQLEINNEAILKIPLLLSSFPFPILPYFPFFLIGAHFAHKKINYSVKWYFLFAFLALTTLLTINQTLEVPRRIPPSTSWLLLPFFPIYLVYLCSVLLSKVDILATYLSQIGENILLHLLVSNVLIFTFKGMYPHLNLSIISILSLTFLIICINQIFISIFLIRKK